MALNVRFLDRQTGRLMAELGRFATVRSATAIPTDRTFVWWLALAGRNQSALRKGKPLEGLRKPWDRAKCAAGLAADLRIHDLRHSLASALANAGTPLYEIGVVLGHRQLSTTTRYAHHSPQRMVETATAAARAWNLLPAPEEAEG